MFGSVDEAHTVLRIAQEFLACFQVFEDPGFVLFPEISFVPWRLYSNSIFSGCPDIIGFVGATRSSAWILVFSSVDIR